MEGPIYRADRDYTSVRGEHSGVLSLETGCVSKGRNSGEQTCWENGRWRLLHHASVCTSRELIMTDCWQGSIIVWEIMSDRLNMSESITIN